MSPLFAIFIHNFKTTFRNWKTNIIILLLPIIFMGIFGMVFGSNNTEIEFSVGIYSELNQLDIANVFRKADESSEKISITITNFTTEEAAEAAIKNKEANISVLAKQSQQSNSPQFTIINPTADLNTIIYESITKDILMQVLFAEQNPIIIKTNEAKVINTTQFDILAPGLMVYGLLILLPNIIKRFSEITEQNYLFRYAVSNISSSEIILGNVLFYIVLGLAQTVILYATARLFGYNAEGNVLLALVPVFFTLFFVIALGLLIGSLFKKTDPAMNVGSIVSIILGFFSGSFIVGIGKVLEFEAFGRTFQFNDIFPTRWGTQALDVILTQNKGIGSIQNELWILAISGIITLLLSMWFFSTKRLKGIG